MKQQAKTGADQQITSHQLIKDEYLLVAPGRIPQGILQTWRYL
ncbi:hypothetical protein [Pantoea septica]